MDQHNLSELVCELAQPIQKLDWPACADKPVIPLTLGRAANKGLKPSMSLF